MTTKAFVILKTKAMVGQKITYRFILLNAEQLALQDMEVAFTRI